MKKRKMLPWYMVEFLIIVLALLYSFRGFSMVKGDDGMDQFYPVFVYCGKYIREVIKGILQGQLSFPQFEFSIGMGEGIIPTLNYYGFGDPFMIFSALTPVKYATYAYTAVILLKMFVSGLGFIYYCKKKKLSDCAILVGLPFYVANNFLFYFCFQYPPYQSVLISLPFICAGLDEVIQKKENESRISYVLILSVAFQALYGFYLLYMELVFAAIYALIGILCTVESFKKFMKKVLVLLLHIMFGLAIGGVVFIPAVMGYVNSSRGGDFDALSLELLLHLETSEYWNMFSSVFNPVNYISIGLAIPSIAVMIIIWSIVKKKKEYKNLKILLLLFSVAYVMTRFTSYIAGGFTAEVYYNRWTFCLFFLIAVNICIGVESFIVEAKGYGKWIVYALANTAYYSIIIIVEKQLISVEMSDARQKVYLVYSAFAIISAVLFAVVEKINISWQKSLVSAYVLVAVVLNICTLFGTIQDYGLGAKWNFKAYKSVRNELLSSNAQLYSTEEVFTRKDIAGKAENEALYMGHFGVREYFSMINGNIYNFYNNFDITKGLHGSVHHMTSLDSRSGIEDLLAVAFYDDVQQDVVVKNENYLPIGFTFDSYISEINAEEMSTITKNAGILSTVILDEEVEDVAVADVKELEELWEEEACEIEYVNIDFEDGVAHVTSDSKIRLTVDSRQEGECYFYTERFKLTGNVYVSTVQFGEVECVFRNNNTQNKIKEHPAMVCLGNVEKGKNTFEIIFAENEEYLIDDIHIYTIDTTAMEKLNAKRQDGALQNIIVKNDIVRGDIELSDKQILFLSIPYGKGWTAYVNGEETEILKANYGFMALSLEKGYNSIMLKYFTPGLKLGIVCTGIGIVLLIFLHLYTKKEKRKQRVVK